MEGKQISINFCGGCNPRIDRGLIAAEVASILAAEGYLVFFNQPAADLIIYLSGCTANCAEPVEPGETLFVTVAGDVFEQMKAAENELVAMIVKAVRSFLVLRCSG